MKYLMVTILIGPSVFKIKVFSGEIKKPKHYRNIFNESKSCAYQKVKEVLFCVFKGIFH